MESDTFNPLDYITPIGEPLSTILIGATNEVCGLWDDDFQDLYVSKYAAVPPPSCLQNETNGALDWDHFLGKSQDLSNLSLDEQWHQAQLMEHLEMEAHPKPLEESWFMSPTTNPNEIDHLTRSGRVYQAPPPNGSSTTQNQTQGQVQNPIPPPLEVEDPLVKQLRQSKANVSIWELLSTSKEHRNSLMNALTALSVSTDTTPQDLVSLLTSEKSDKSIIFTNDDLPSKDTTHNNALYLTVGCKGYNIPLTLVDNGSAVNVCPLRTAKYLGLIQKKIFNQQHKALGPMTIREDRCVELLSYQLPQAQFKRWLNSMLWT